MKNLIVSIATLFVFTTFTYGQQSDSSNTDLPYKNLLKIKPVNILLGQYGISYERVLTKRVTLELNSDIEFEDINFFGEKVGNAYQLDIGMDLRYYFAKNKIAPKGWYLGTGLSTSFARAKLDENLSSFEDNLDGSAIAGRAYLGYQWVFKNGINLGLLGGIKYTTSITEGIDFNEFDPLIGVSIGYSW